MSELNQQMKKMADVKKHRLPRPAVGSELTESEHAGRYVNTGSSLTSSLAGSELLQLIDPLPLQTTDRLAAIETSNISETFLVSSCFLWVDSSL
jgi:hypothetical protein